MVSVLIFTSIDFLPSLTRTNLSHMHCSVKPSLRRQAFTAPEPPTPTHHDRDLVGHRNCADRRRSRSRSRRSTSIAIAPIDVDCDRADRRRSRSSKSARLRSRSRRSRSLRSRSRSRSHREIDLSFWVLFEFLGMNDIMCLFGS